MYLIAQSFFLGSLSLSLSVPLGHGHVAASEVGRDDGDEPAERGPHLRPVDHLVVRPTVELEERDERLARLLRPADVALLAEEGGRRLEEGRARGTRRRRRVRGSATVTGCRHRAAALRQWGRREQALPHGGGVAVAVAVDGATWRSGGGGREGEGPGVELGDQRGSQWGGVGGPDFGGRRVGEAEVPRLERVELVVRDGEGEA